jgi:hypothetical protein
MAVELESVSDETIELVPTFNNSESESDTNTKNTKLSNSEREKYGTFTNRNANVIGNRNVQSMDDDYDSTSIMHLSRQRLLLGALYSCIGGVAYTFGLMPMLFAPINAYQLRFSLSAFIGQMITLPFSPFLLLLTKQNNSGNNNNNDTDTDDNKWRWKLFKQIVCCSNDIWKFDFVNVFLPTFTAGFILGVANGASIIAVSLIDFVTVTSLLTVFTIVTSSICAIVLYSELKSCSQLSLFFIFLASMIGATILSGFAIYGQL